MYSQDRAAFSLGPEDRESLWCVGSLSTIKVLGPETNGAYAMIEDLAPQGSGAPPHRHELDDEAFYILEGEVTFAIGDDDPMRATPGSFVFIPGGVTHAFEVNSFTARYLIITTPRHMQFYRAIADPAQARTLPPEAPFDPARICAACAAFGVNGVESPDAADHR